MPFAALAHERRRQRRAGVASVSLASTLPLTARLFVVVAASSTATGASLTPVTVIVTVATFETAVPSFAV